MIRKKIMSMIGLLLAFSLSACSGQIQVELPTDTPTTGEIQTATEMPETPGTVAEPVLTTMEPTDLQSLQVAYEQVYDRVLPSVVSISVIRTVTGVSSMFPGFPFGEDENQPEFQQQGAGSGFVWDKAGHIITNNHVVEGADIIRVQFSDGSIALGELIGADPASDLAVVLVNAPAEKLQPIEATDSTAVRIGQIAIAIGNPFQLEGSMTTGIVSGMGRSLSLSENIDGTSFTIPDLIQTDASINPGNSGGVLVDIHGRLIGVTTAIESPVQANAGVGYAVPSIIVEKIVPFLITEGSYQQPWIGIRGSTLTPELAEAMDVDPDQKGALVREVISNSPADEAGLRGSHTPVTIYGSDTFVGGDIVTAIDGQPIQDFEDVVAYLARYTNVGTEITLTILRDNQTLEVELTLGARPEQESPSLEAPEEIQADVWLGITGIDLTDAIAEAMDLDPNTQGVLVQQVSADSPADKAGILGSYQTFETESGTIVIGGDVIVALNDEPVNGLQSLLRSLRTYEPGDEITLTALRDGSELEIELTLAERPA